MNPGCAWGATAVVGCKKQMQPVALSLTPDLHLTVTSSVFVLRDARTARISAPGLPCRHHRHCGERSAPTTAAVPALDQRLTTSQHPAPGGPAARLASRSQVDHCGRVLFQDISVPSMATHNQVSSCPFWAAACAARMYFCSRAMVACSGPQKWRRQCSPLSAGAAAPSPAWLSFAAPNSTQAIASLPCKKFLLS